MRRERGAAGSTIRRELGTLTRMLRLAYENGKRLRLPILHKPKEAAPREGFFEREQYDAVRRRLLLDLQAATAIAYTFGWRMQSEGLTLDRRQLETSGPVRCAWSPAVPKTTRRGWSTSPRSSRPCSPPSLSA